MTTLEALWRAYAATWQARSLWLESDDLAALLRSSDALAIIEEFELLIGAVLVEDWQPCQASTPEQALALAAAALEGIPQRDRPPGLLSIYTALQALRITTTVRE